MSQTSLQGAFFRAVDERGLSRASADGYTEILEVIQDLFGSYSIRSCHSCSRSSKQAGARIHSPHCMHLFWSAGITWQER